jgi:acetoacetyl-CoA reductase/3-oxoacyl-[acyl-carrier protein] reductase
LNPVLHTFPGIAGRTAVVTGGGRGIGRAIAEDLMGAGAEVHVLDLQPGTAAGLHCRRIDIRDPAAIDAVLKELTRPATLLVNNAGITRDRTLTKMSDDEWHEVIDVNLTGAFNMIRAVAPGMKAAGHGRIVNVSSINGLRGKFGQGNYAASKAGLIGLTKTAARELGVSGITVNAVAPGLVLTDMARELAPELREKALEETQLKRLAEPQDVANAVLFLLSDLARVITGAVLRVDAGQYL